MIPEYPWQGEDGGSAHFRDVMTHTSPGQRWTKAGADPSTIGHETHHGLVAEVSNQRGGKARFFYFERGLGAFVEAPKQSLRVLRQEVSGPVYAPYPHTNLLAVRDFLPDGAKKLAASRYETYLVNADRATYSVLYLFDEWNAYIAGARIAIENYMAGFYDDVTKPRRTADGTSRITHIGELDGMIDFLYFASAGVLALAEREPESLRGNEQLKAVYAVFAEETLRWWVQGRVIELFQGFHGADLLEHFRTSPENERVRTYLKGWLGPEWTSRVFGF
jgi:hypothetical protein